MGRVAMRRRLALWLRERSLGAPRLNPSSTAAHAADSQVGHSRPAALSLMLGVLGVVYGDIGTSPLYALRPPCSTSRPTGSTAARSSASCPCILWSLLLVGHGEVRLLDPPRRQPRRRRHPGPHGAGAARRPRRRTGAGSSALLGIAGAGLFFGDGCITPAISVLSAVEGLEGHLAPLRGRGAADLGRRPRRACSWCSTAAPAPDGRGVRPGHGAVVHHHRPARPVRDRRSAGGAGRRLAAPRRDLPRIPPASPPSSPWARWCSR